MDICIRFFVFLSPPDLDSASFFLGTLERSINIGTGRGAATPLFQYQGPFVMTKRIVASGDENDCVTWRRPPLIAHAPTFRDSKHKQTRETADQHEKAVWDTAAETAREI